MKIYTSTGDKGKTSLIGGRVDKDSLRVEAYGTMDELNSFVGKAMTELDPDNFRRYAEDLEAIQNELFDGGGDLANVMKERHYKLSEEPIEVLEQRIDELMEEAPPLGEIHLTGWITCCCNTSYCTNCCETRRTPNGDAYESGRRCTSSRSTLFEQAFRLSFRCSTHCQFTGKCTG